jgi:hypothetical protein
MPDRSHTSPPVEPKGYNFFFEKNPSKTHVPVETNSLPHLDPWERVQLTYTTLPVGLLPAMGGLVSTSAAEKGARPVPRAVTLSLCPCLACVCANIVFGPVRRTGGGWHAYAGEPLRPLLALRCLCGSCCGHGNDNYGCRTCGRTLLRTRRRFMGFRPPGGARSRQLQESKGLAVSSSIR